MAMSFIGSMGEWERARGVWFIVFMDYLRIVSVMHLQRVALESEDVG